MYAFWLCQQVYVSKMLPLIDSNDSRTGLQVNIEQAK